MNHHPKDTLDHDEATEVESNVQSSDYRDDSLAASPQHATTTATSATASALIIAASDKAGMQGIDRSKIDAIILRESGNSAYMQQQRKRDETVNQKIQQLQRKLLEAEQQAAAKDPHHWRERIEQELQGEIESLQSTRSLHSTCVVVDLDMFYVNCELLTRPHLRNVPTVVGGSMILTSNYCARQYGVRSAMAGWIGDKLVEELSGGKQKLVHLPSNFTLYREKSEVVRRVLAEYDPQLRAYSLDEAYLSLGPYLVKRLQHPSWTHEDIRTALQPQSEDATEEMISESQQDENDDDDDDADQQQEDIDLILSSFPPQQVLDTASEIVSNMRKQVHDATGGLTCSAGLAPNFMLAKIASDYNKPNGQKVVGPSHRAVLEFSNPLPIRKIPGIGRVTEKQLHAFGISTVHDLYEQRALVRFLFQPTTARFLLRASMGLSSSSSSSSDTSSAGQKGISRERTFASGRPWADIMSRLEDIARLLSSDMERKNIRAHTLTVKVKLHTFDVLSKSRTLARGVYLHAAEDMIPLASELLMELRKQHAANTKSKLFSVRLLGIRCSNFQGQDEKQVAGSMNIERFLTKDAPTKRTRSPTPPPPPSSSLRSPHLSLSPATTRAGRTIQTKLIPVATASPKSSSPSDRAGASQSATHDESTNNDDAVAALTTTELQQCPLCQQTIQPETSFESYNAVVNRHIDSCLNATVVRQAVREESGHYNKKQRLTDFFERQVGGGSTR